MTEMLQRSLGPSVEIETRFPLALSAVRADSNQLELALLNLAVNARDAMRGGGSLIISAREEVVTAGHDSKLPPGAYVCLAVTDAGEGMDEETLRRAMEPFFTTKGPGKGTGLGLSMVHGVTEQSGGRLILKSRVGEGTTAEMWLPAAKLAAVAELKVQAPPPAEKKPVRVLTVLAVDDDTLVLMNTTAMLEDLGHTVFSAISGSEALKVLRARKVDVIVTDQAMPQMTGYELAEIAKAEWPHIPVILATGYAELPADHTAIVQKLSKPFWQHQLAQAVADATDPGPRPTLRVVSGP